MADDLKNNDSARRQISDKDRFRYIGFDVYPGKPKDLFKTEAEKQKLIDARREKRERGEIIREECMLFEDRVSTFDRVILALASIVMVAALFIPFFSIYNEVEETVKSPAPTQTTSSDTLAASGMVAPTDSLSMMAGDSAAMAATAAGAAAAVADSAADTATATPPVAAQAEESATPERASQKVSESEEIIHGYVAHKRYHKEYARLSGIGVFGALGSVGSVAFSSGIVIVVSSILMLLYIVLCVALPILTLYGLFGSKGDADSRALALKRILRLNWLPLVVFAIVLILSFFGGSYSRPVGDTFSSLGSDYNVGVFLDTLSFGLIVSLAASILVAAKGSEI